MEAAAVARALLDRGWWTATSLSAVSSDVSAAALPVLLLPAPVAVLRAGTTLRDDAVPRPPGRPLREPPTGVAAAASPTLLPPLLVATLALPRTMTGGGGGIVLPPPMPPLVLLLTLPSPGSVR